MGAVYKARQPKLNRFVAIKVLPRIEDDAMGFAQRFEREAQSMAQLSHPHIVPVYDFGETEDGQLYFVMEFVEGADLHQLIHGVQLTSRHFFSWIPQVCAALEYAHDHGVVHRDIKPANILINKEGQVRVVDFGLAKLTSSDPKDPRESSLTHHSLSMGTPDYAAPEQIETGSDIDGRADIYSLGVVMYQMLTGRVPRGAFRNPSAEVPGIDTRLDEVVLRAMQACPADRFQRPSEISTRLQEIQSSKDSSSDSNSAASSTIPKFNLPAAKKAKPRSLATVAPKVPTTPPTPAPITESKPATSKARKIGIGVAIAAVLAIIVIAAIPSGLENSKLAQNSASTKNSTNKPGTSASEAREKDKAKAKGKQKPMSTDGLPKLPSRTPPPLPADAKSKTAQKNSDKLSKPKIDRPENAKPEPPKPAATDDSKESIDTPKGPDRRRRMFGERSDNERRSYKNLTLISRSERPLDNLPLTKIPATLGIVTHLVIGQATGDSKKHPPFAIARDTDGKIHSWGGNQHGALDIPEVVRSISTSGELSDLRAGSHHVLALDRSGKVYAWGSDEHGQSSVPTALSSSVIQIAAARDLSAALLSDGTVRVWGGDPALAPPENLTAVKKIAVGNRAILALHENNTITCWSSDPEIARHTPLADDVVDIAIVDDQNFALTGDGQLLGWSDRPAKRPLPKLMATAIQSARDILAVQLRSGGWIFFTRDPRDTPASPPINRRHLNAAASADVIFSWVYEDDGNSQTFTTSDSSIDPKPVTLPPAAQAAIDEVQQRLEELYLERVETPYQESLTTLNNYYLQYLEADAGVAQSNAQLDTLVAIKAEKERMQNGEAVPTEDEEGTPAALANRRKIYRHTLQSYEEIRITAEAELNHMYIDKLELMQADFTREGDTESALAIRDFRDRFAATHTTPSIEVDAGEAAIESDTTQP
jgi:serine/threonine protein kinase